VLAHTIVIVAPDGLVILQDHTNYVCGVAITVYKKQLGPQHFGRKIHAEDSRYRRGEATPNTICVWGRDGAIHGVTRLSAQPLRGLLSRRAPTRIIGKLAYFLIPW
jgi:hypothetical protein